MNTKKINILSVLEKIINTLFYIWIGIILIGALNSENLFNSNVPFRSIIIFNLIALILIFVIILKYYNSQRTNDLFIKIPWRYKVYSLLILSLLLLCWQIYFIFKSSTGIGFDAGIIVSEVINHSTVSEPFRYNYFSFYPNNLLLLYTEYLWSSFFGATWISFSFLSLFSVDLFMLITLTTVYMIDRNIFLKTWVIFLIWLSVFPYIIVPYTDTIGLPLISSYILGYTLLKRTNLFWVKGIGAIIFGTFLMLSYLMKPTAIIPVIAIAIIELAYLFHQFDVKKFNYLNYILIILFIMSAVGTKYAYQVKTDQQDYVHINKELKIPAIHFIGMGLHGEGGFDKNDANKMYASRSTKEMKKVSNENIKKQIRKYSLAQYGLFLLNKNRNNTADGSFGWLQEGNFIDKKPNNFIQNWVYPKGEYLHYFHVMVQIIWILALLILLVDKRRTESLHKNEMIFKLALLGGLTYLLIFEGGRSRYLIQFMPIIIPLLGMSSPFRLKKTN